MKIPGTPSERNEYQYNTRRHAPHRLVNQLQPARHAAIPVNPAGIAQLIKVVLHN